MAKRLLTINGTLAVISVNFFLTGSLFCLNDVIFPIVKERYSLSFTATTLIQLVFYMVYIPFPMFINFLIKKFGYAFNVHLAFILCALGSMCFMCLRWWGGYSLILTAICVLSVGIVCINTAIMPYITLIGNPAQAQFRANLVQMFSRLGYSATPLVANFLIFMPDYGGIEVPYAIVGFIFFLLLVVVILFPLPEPAISQINLTNTGRSDYRAAIRIPYLYWGVLAMFFYLGCEAGIASFFINYLMDPDVMSLTLSQATVYLTAYNTTSTLMAFLGLYLIRKYAANKVLAVFGLFLFVLLLGCIFLYTGYEGYVLVAAGGFLSIMFPTLYGLAIRDLGPLSSLGAAWVSMAISGGAFFPVIQGYIADHYGIRFGYFVPVICVFFVIVYAVYLSNLRAKEHI